jgi:hypothetical protein
MIGLAILVCLLAGPDGKWVKKFLPTTANRLVFLITVLFIVGSGISQGIDSLRHGEKGLGYFSLAMYGLCVLALWRFINSWWINKAVSGERGA